MSKITYDYRVFVHKGRMWIDEIIHEPDYFDIREVCYDELGYILSVSDDPVYISGYNTGDIKNKIQDCNLSLTKPALDFEVVISKLENDELVKERDVIVD